MKAIEQLRCSPRTTDRLLALINGYRVSQAIYVIATLGIPDLLPEGPRSSEELADRTGSNRDALLRVLRALTGVDVLREDKLNRFVLTDLGEGLRSDVPQSRNAWARFVARPPMWGAWGATAYCGQGRMPSSTCMG